MVGVFWRRVIFAPGAKTDWDVLPGDAGDGEPAAARARGLWREGSRLRIRTGERRRFLFYLLWGPGGWEVMERLAMRIRFG